MSYVVAFYDISDNRRRLAAAERLRGLGFQRVQRSVYIAKGDSRLAREAFRALMRVVDKVTDSVFVLVVHKECMERALVHGPRVGVREASSTVI